MSKWKAVILHKDREIARKTFDSYDAAKERAKDITDTAIVKGLEYDLKKVEDYIL